jgi:Ras-related protein Rab-18
VRREEGHEFARAHGCLYVETSAKTNVAVGQAFEELVLKILETPGLLENLSLGGVRVGEGGAAQHASACSC